mmetsp:Transcript_45823/g.132205  ORF Transcript_45823/g.132205 Transcript_45823/m.132205 type:complete len:217 (-) Transcript_45823:515-1165(-)
MGRTPRRRATTTSRTSASEMRQLCRRPGSTDDKSADVLVWKASASRSSTVASTFSTRAPRCWRAGHVICGRTATTTSCVGAATSTHHIAARVGASSTRALAPWSTRRCRMSTSREFSAGCQSTSPSRLARGRRQWRRLARRHRRLQARRRLVGARGSSRAPQPRAPREAPRAAATTPHRRLTSARAPEAEPLRQMRGPMRRRTTGWPTSRTTSSTR